jgi:hypothetical protein
MADGIRLDLQRALAEGPGAIPNLEPLFAPGAIPPVFDEAPEVGLNDVGIDLETGQGTFSGVPMDAGQASIGQPVPPVKESRGDRLRALLGNFLQNFGTGLQAASRAPSGAEFAAGFGGALGAGEERRQQKSREELLRANQAFREQQAREIQELREDQFAFQRQQAEAGRIERENVRAGAERRTFQERLRARTERAADLVAGRRGRAGQREFLRGQQRERLGATAEQGRLSRKLQRELATTRAAGRGGLSVKDAYSIAARNVQVALGAEPFLDSDKTIKDFSQASREIQRQAAQIFQDANGREPSKEEIAAIAPNIDRLRPFIKEIGRAVQDGTATEEELRLVIQEALVNGEINEADARILGQGFGLVSQPTSALERIRGRKKAEPTPERNRFLPAKAGIPTPRR